MEMKVPNESQIGNEDATHRRKIAPGTFPMLDEKAPLKDFMIEEGTVVELIENDVGKRKNGHLVGTSDLICHPLTDAMRRHDITLS